MDKLLSPYYQAIAQSIEAEVSSINNLFHHQGVKGQGNENILENLLRKFLPKKYAVGTGVVIDQEGRQSKQCDIVIYDAFNYPEIFSQTEINFFPIDFVYAVIEIKTTLDQQKMNEAIENIRSVRSLKYIKQTFRETPTEPIKDITNDTVMWNNVSTTAPQGYIFGFSSIAKKFETFNDWFVVQGEDESYPGHVFCLDQGILVNHGAKGVKNFICPLHDKEKDEYFTDEDGDIRERKDRYYVTISGKEYPLSEAGKQKIAIDQSKVLLEFLTILNKMLSLKKLSPNIDVYNDYLPQDYKLKFSLCDGKLVVIR
ncbi:hypothetical protein JFR02_005074 [Vibrio harveyi]|nr:hypothetical protein [Vibrio harveyi]